MSDWSDWPPDASRDDLDRLRPTPQQLACRVLPYALPKQRFYRIECRFFREYPALKLRRNYTSQRVNVYTLPGVISQPTSKHGTELSAHMRKFHPRARS